MSVAQTSNKLVDSLPRRLRYFFTKYPPQYYSAAVAPRPQPATTEGTTASAEGTGTGTQSETPAAEATPATTPTPTTQATTTEPASTTPPTTTDPTDPESAPTPYTASPNTRTPKSDPLNRPSRLFLHSDPERPNPFLPRKNFRTGKWFGPQYGLRKQADMVKLAIRHGVEELLPPGKKSSEYKMMRRAERGLAVKGTGVGHNVKGHKWERTLEERLEERKKAMVEMPELINTWKEVSFFGLFWRRLVGIFANYVYSKVVVVPGLSGPSILRSKDDLAWFVWHLVLGFGEDCFYRLRCCMGLFSIVFMYNRYRMHPLAGLLWIASSKDSCYEQMLYITRKYVQSAYQQTRNSSIHIARYTRT